MKLRIFLTLTIIGYFFFSFETVKARFEFLEQIPNGHRLYSLNLSNCQAIGHLRQNLEDPSSWCEPGNGLNQFGRDFLEAGLHWTRALCEKDSDGDGLSNGVELGDPCCLWAPGATPFRLEPLSLPNDPYSTVPIQYDVVDCRTDIIFGPQPTVNTDDSISSPIQSPESIINSPSPSATADLPIPSNAVIEPLNGEAENIDQNLPETSQAAPTFHFIKTHASLGSAGFMLLLPLGFYSSRYLQPVIGETWWLYASLLFQVGGFSCVLSGVIVLLNHTKDIQTNSTPTAHNIIGFISVCLVFVQLVNSLFQLGKWKNSFGRILGALSPFLAIVVLSTGVIDALLGIKILQDTERVIESIQRTQYIFLVWIITQIVLLPLAELCFVLWRISGGDKLQEGESEDKSKGLYRRAGNEYYYLLGNENNIPALHVLESDSDNEEYSPSRSMQTNGVSQEETSRTSNQESFKTNLQNSDLQSSEIGAIKLNQLESLWLWLRRLPWIIGIVAALCTVVFGSIVIHFMSHIE
ncbi:hypothetical protein GpartN1_g2088.t1 [Galdieria partita]|uniref:Cytochrome b561 domain-containing protein n=1 Tax=Galdieria partita TaxID=83374 RepID=A0A9C7UPA9_9RHOD|nr:hypothetical protein GpartN1_g2088.t1 [Galdieria partita]